MSTQTPRTRDYNDGITVLGLIRIALAKAPADALTRAVLFDLGDGTLLAIGRVTTLTDENEDIPPETYLVLVAEPQMGSAVIEAMHASREEVAS